MTATITPEIETIIAEYNELVERIARYRAEDQPEYRINMVRKMINDRWEYLNEVLDGKALTYINAAKTAA